jgi:hypothetical protein
MKIKLTELRQIIAEEVNKLLESEGESEGGEDKIFVTHVGTSRRSSRDPVKTSLIHLNYNNKDYQVYATGTENLLFHFENKEARKTKTATKLRWTLDKLKPKDWVLGKKVELTVNNSLSKEQFNELKELLELLAK